MSMTAMSAPDPVGPSEADIHKQILQYLGVALPRGTLIHHSPNERKSKMEAIRMKYFGTLSGWPDLQFIYKGVSYYLEVKRKRGFLSKTQRLVIDRMLQEGVGVAVVRSIFDVQQALERWNIPVLAKVHRDPRRPARTAAEGMKKYWASLTPEQRAQKTRGLKPRAKKPPKPKRRMLTFLARSPDERSTCSICRVEKLAVTGFFVKRKTPKGTHFDSRCRDCTKIITEFKNAGWGLDAEPQAIIKIRRELGIALGDD